MRYPLVNRFRGAFLGGFIGEILALNSAEKSTKKSNDCIWWYELIASSAQSLIRLGRFDFDHWGTQVRKKWDNCDSSKSILDAAIIATLPVTLFLHDNKVQLRNNLIETLDIWDNDPEIRDSVLAVSYVVAQSLNEKVCWKTLLPQTVDFIGDPSTKLSKKLFKIDNSINYKVLSRNAPIFSEREITPTTTIELAFYYFISSPEDFRLCVSRADRNPYLGVETISGILSGTYNSTSGIPANWQVGQSNLNIAPSLFTSCSQMLELADALVAVWSGVYELTSNSRTLEEKSVIAAPGVIWCR